MPVPFAGREFTFGNPDGSEIRVRGWGNQFAAVFETLDGYTVVRDPDSGSTTTPGRPGTPGGSWPRGPWRARSTRGPSASRRTCEVVRNVPGPPRRLPATGPVNDAGGRFAASNGGPGSRGRPAMTAAGRHYECSLEQADHRFVLEQGVNRGDTGDLFGGRSARSFGRVTAPGSRWWDGSSSGLELAQISATAPTITVKTALTPPTVTARSSLSSLSSLRP